MKNTIKNILLLLTCTILSSLLAGCGGGGGGGDFTDPAAVFDLATAQDNLYNGSSFSLSGSDNQGGNYTATMAFSNQGVAQINGVDTTHILLDLSLTQTNTNASITGTKDYYFTTGYEPVLQIENPGDVHYTPTSSTILPATASIGESGPMATYSKSNGETEVDTWSLDSTTNGRAKLTFHTTTRDAVNAIIDQETNAITIDTAGTVFAIKSQVIDSSGAVLTLSGNKQ